MTEKQEKVLSVIAFFVIWILGVVLASYISEKTRIDAWRKFCAENEEIHCIVNVNEP